MTDTVTETQQLSVEEWMAPGRKTIEGYLHVSRGPIKRRLGLLDGFIVQVLEEHAGKELLPRYADLHAVWYGFDPTKDRGYQMVRPFLRYKAPRPIDGLSREHHGHRVRLTCTIGSGANWKNGLGAYITRASGECLTCAGGDDRD